MNIDELRSMMSPDVREYAERIMEMYEAPFARFVGLEISEITRDRVVCYLDLRPELMNSMGRGHGGAVYTLIDHTFAIAANLVHDSTGQNTNVSFYRPAQGRLTAVAVPINRSRSLEVYDVRVTNDEGKLVASSVCTAFVLRRD
ncbi:MAG: PaaI family thioesterase [Candidatus Methanomethylophilaceae archaeon]|nr:PaaI family thioesterase [Candidatus Methanomethylophilaceae archaeon]